MTEDKKDKKEEIKADNKNIDKNTDAGAKKAVARSVYGEKKRVKKSFKKKDAPKDEFEQRILDLARVTRVMAGGKRMRFRATVAVGDKKSKVGVGVGKGADVTIAVNKAVNDAKKKLITVSIINETIPHEIFKKHGASKLLFKPAKKGRGVIAGGVVRVILELSGIKNVTSKILGTNNKINNAKATIEALKDLKNVENSPRKDLNKKTKKAEETGKEEGKKNDSNIK